MSEQFRHNIPLPVNPLSHIVEWFDKARPEATPEDFQSQLGCHFEEVKEMLDEIVSTSITGTELIDAAKKANHELAEFLKTNAMTPCTSVPEANRIGFIDAVVDQIVTVTGSARAVKMDVVGAAAEVSWSNWTKFDEHLQPIRNPQTQKVMKGPYYEPADLTPYV
jgi:predicted HAD superfamily Cof-like phosphohydrolase